MPIFLHKKISSPSSSAVPVFVKDGDAGFSLLEILIVLAIMGVMMALVAPRMVSSIESARFSRTVELAAQQVSQLRAQAILEKKPIVFAPSGVDRVNVNALTLTQLDMPSEWQVSGGPIFIASTGLCEGGFVRFTNENGQSADFKFNAPLCRAERVTQFERGA